uniref:Uncharacterized protein n=1 Tax=Angiostrongylus cantonensis TaxID=6313 RepID=A0A158P9V4_ANGCA
MLSSSFVEHAVLGFAFAVLSLFVLAFSIVAVVLVTVTNNCWWNCGADLLPIFLSCLSIPTYTMKIVIVMRSPLLAELTEAVRNDEGDPLMEDCNSSYSHFEDCEDGGTETVDTVIGRTPSNAAIV